MITEGIKFKNIRDIKLKIYPAFIGLIAIMPVVDSVSGGFHDRIPIGQIYRIVLFGFMVFLLAKNSRKKFTEIIITFGLMTLVQVIVSGSYKVKSLQTVMKLFIPITMIILLDLLIKKNKIAAKSIFEILDVWSIAYPILIIIPGALGIGGNAYDGAVGWKGMFYAVNEISFIMSSLVMYLFWKLRKNVNVKTLIILIVNCLCIGVMGTKTGYVTVFVFSLLFILEFWKNTNQKKIAKIILFILIVVCLIILNYQRIISMTSAIFERWRYQKTLSYSMTDFLFSMRLRRLSNAWKIFVDGGYWILGWGLGGENIGLPNMEMDFLDLLFRTGIVSFTLILSFYIKWVIKVSKGNFPGFMMVMWSLALSFGAGHVLFYGQSGMMLAVNFILATLIKKGIKGYWINE